MPRSLKGTFETILAVDDGEDVLKVVVAILKRAHFRVLSARNGPDAIKVAAKTDEKIDLLLSDLDMPQMSGADLGETLKKTRTGPARDVDVGGRERKFIGSQLRLGLYSEAVCGGEIGSDDHRSIALTKPVTTRRSGI